MYAFTRIPNSGILSSTPQIDTAMIARLLVCRRAICSSCRICLNCPFAFTYTHNISYGSDPEATIGEEVGDELLLICTRDGAGERLTRLKAAPARFANTVEATVDGSHYVVGRNAVGPLVSQKPDGVSPRSQTACLRTVLSVA